ncbi:MAG TPA: beta-galactosidase GalB [Verrucomicrobiae bacterium]|nr:beta-galactosidase GalB [Verrucomicrobiae bacterium]
MKCNRVRRVGLLAVTVWISLFTCLAADDAPLREKLLFNSNWRFIQGDPEGAGTNLSYAAIRPWMMATGGELSTNAAAVRPEGNPGADVSYTQPDYDDSAWRKLNLPHDWGIEGPFKQEHPGETGKLPWWGVAWYRKQFTVPAADRGRQFYLHVDGAMSFANVWVNGQYAGGWPYGYASWRVDLTPHIRAGGNNVIAIRLDNPEESSRWYPGGGIYRNVWLERTAPVHVDQWGTFVTTPVVTASAATVKIDVQVRNASTADARVFVKNQIFELDAEGDRGRAAGDAGMLSIETPAGGTGKTTMQIPVKSPRLWSISKPNRYVAVTSIERDGRVVDRYETPFGIRTFEFTVANGFLLNGKRVPLNGVCNHHDLGALGAALNTRALERQLELLQEMGCNAIRTSHNPPAPELLELCDRMGFVVIDEFSDTWSRPKKRNGYALIFRDWAEKDMRALVRRDRNHPCVVMWSTGNEIPEQGNTNLHSISRWLTDISHQEDPTRPVTVGCNNIGAGYNGFQKTLDVFGYNYKPQEYGKFRAANPGIPLYGSETASCVSSRGEYFFPVSDDKSKGMADFHVSSYDLYAPRWAMPPDQEFQGQDEFPFVAGEFVWTGFDYLGEPTPYNADLSNLLNYTDPADKARAEQELREIGRIRVPSRSSYFGIIDLAGFKKDRFYIYQARWRPELPMAHILPHWNWPDRVGQVTPIHVYTSGDEAELFLNGKSQGRKKKGQFTYRLRWDDVVYQPGEVRVVAYKGGKRWATAEVKTAGEASQVTLEADRRRIRADGRDLAFVTALVADRRGGMVPRAKNRIRFEIEGPGELIATDNGSPIDFESFQSVERNAFNGMALAIVRTKPGESGTITVKATADGLEAATVRIRSRR